MSAATGSVPDPRPAEAPEAPEVPEDSASASGPAGKPEKHPVDQGLPPLRLMGAGLQHVASMYAGVVAPPLVVGVGVGLSTADIAFLMSASLFTSGIATLIQTLGFWKIGSRLPFVNGVSFAGVAPMLAIAKAQNPEDALPVIYGAVLVAGVFGFLIAPFFGKLIRFFPPVVTGTVITLIGVSLLPVAFNWSQGGNRKAEDYGSLTNIGLAAASLLLTVLLRRVLTGFLKQLSILFGLAAGTVLALVLGLADFSSVGEADLIGLPTPFHFGPPQFAVAAIVSMCIVMLVIMTETTADVLALGQIVDKPADEPTLAAALRADALGTVVSPLFNGFAASAFAQNVGLVAVTKMRSRFVVAAAGVILIALGLCPILAQVVALIPQPVLGGVGVVLFGTVAASGVQTLAGAGLGRGDNVLIVAISLGIGLIPMAAPTFYHAFPEGLRIVLDSGISTGCIAAVALNLAFNHLGRKGAADEEAEPEPAAAHAAH
ncbi:nucleobase:cation symporter-2 family protein (plasmid) [Streptomyces sp. BI20]|uniref:nucleobase:cation symporter-2 family protein n=1 Tax=Streptomyces sp. BI20 TaxID=3403460 RepID=UPI003C792B01